VVIWAVAAVLAVLAGMRLLGGGDDPPAVSVDGAGARAGHGAGAGLGDAGAEVFVHVVGAVRRPGLIRVAPDTRVATALDRAGGPTRRADLTLVNLAAKVQDGQQIVVPALGAGGGAGAAGAGEAAGGGSGGAGGGGAAGTVGGGVPGATGSTPGAKLPLSTATVEQLEEIDGIGPTLAARIIEYRDTHAPLRSIAELTEVDGIGEKRLATLRDALQP